MPLLYCTVVASIPDFIQDPHVHLMIVIKLPFKKDFKSKLRYDHKLKNERIE